MTSTPAATAAAMPAATTSASRLRMLAEPLAKRHVALVTPPHCLGNDDRYKEDGYYESQISRTRVSAAITPSVPTCRASEGSSAHRTIP